MKTISIPLVQTADGRITYLGDASKWFGSRPVGDKLVGDYAGPLFAGNGTTKLFDWSYSNALGQAPNSGRCPRSSSILRWSKAVSRRCS